MIFTIRILILKTFSTAVVNMSVEMFREFKENSLKPLWEKFSLVRFSAFIKVISEKKISLMCQD